MYNFGIGGNRSFNTIDHNQPSALPPRPVSETDSKVSPDYFK